jgi:hypothetical protein
MRGRIKKLEHAARGEMVEVPQRDGTVKRFPESALADAYINLCERLGAGEDAPAEHPLLVAARNSPDPEWCAALWLGGNEDPEEWVKPVPDLSE